MKKFWNWLVKSSVDPTKTALTVKGFLTAIIPLLLITSGMFNVNTDEAQIMQAVDQIANLVLQALTLVGGIMSVWGIMRKIAVSFQ